MTGALGVGMRASKLEDLLIYRKALEGLDEVSPLLKRPQFIRDFDLHKQLTESCGKIPGHIGEGFGQGTDRHFAHYLVIARGSALETRGHLAAARQRQHISRDEEIAAACTKTSLTCSVDSSRTFDARIGRIAGKWTPGLSDSKTLPTLPTLPTPRLFRLRRLSRLQDSPTPRLFRLPASPDSFI
jgi:four helix bundle protein